MVDRDQLGDHAAHRGADDMGALDAERVHESDSVVGHVVQGVGNVGPVSRPSLPPSARGRPAAAGPEDGSTCRCRGCRTCTTRNPFAASPWHSASGQKMSWAAKPMMRRMSGSPSRPKLSYSTSIPLARTCGMAALRQPSFANLAEAPPPSTRSPHPPDPRKRPRALLHRLLRRDPSEAGELMARPGELPLGVMAGVELRASRRLGKREPAFEDGR